MGRMPAILRLLWSAVFTSSENVAKTYGARVEPVYLFDEESNDSGRQRESIRSVCAIGVHRKAKAAGHDGLIVHNIVDDATGTVKTPATDYLTFDPTQIKSVFNRGTFDLNDPRLLFQPGRRAARRYLAAAGRHGAGASHPAERRRVDGHARNGALFPAYPQTDRRQRNGAVRDQARQETLKEWWAANADEVAADALHDGVTADDVKAVLRDGTSGDRVKDRQSTPRCKSTGPAGSKRICATVKRRRPAGAACSNNSRRGWSTSISGSPICA